MKPETAVLAVICFALGVLVAQLAEDIHAASKPVPACSFAPRHSALAPVDLVCAHYRATGRAWKCGGML
ncbi:MAG: hypothetical protein Q7J84_10580 [Sulfuricaulis sp.]|nr:hypothetical protein [Sulfuricaulis sp.]